MYDVTNTDTPATTSTLLWKRPKKLHLSCVFFVDGMGSKRCRSPSV